MKGAVGDLMLQRESRRPPEIRSLGKRCLLTIQAMRFLVTCFYLCAKGSVLYEINPQTKQNTRLMTSYRLRTLLSVLSIVKLKAVIFKNVKY